MDFSFLWNGDRQADEAFIQQFLQLLDEGKNEEAYWAFYARYVERICKKLVAIDINSEYRFQIPRIFEEGLRLVIYQDYPNQKIKEKNVIYSYIQKTIRHDYLDYIRQQEAIKRKINKEERINKGKPQIITHEMYADVWEAALADLGGVCKELIKKIKAEIKGEEKKVNDKIKIRLQPSNGEFKALTVELIYLENSGHNQNDLVKKAGLVKVFDKYQKNTTTKNEFDTTHAWLRQTHRRCGENFIDEFIKILKERNYRND